MAYSATVTQSADGTVLTFTDTSTLSGSLVSRTLVISDQNGVVLDTVNMGASLIATYTISADGYFVFTETIIDGSGSRPVIVKYLSTAFYEITFANTISLSGCSCTPCDYADNSLYLYLASIRKSVGGFGVAAYDNINKANILISGN
jgi:hypothetical protein